MIRDIEILMQQQHADALWISGAALHNPSMVYFTKGIHVTQADLFYRLGQEPVLFCGPMERDEAEKTGFHLRSYADYDYFAYLKMAQGDVQKAQGMRYQQMLVDIGLTEGKVMLYGMREFGTFYALLSELQHLLPDLHFYGDVNDAILMEARATKDEEELEHIREMGQITTRVVANTQDFLSGHVVRNEVLIKPDGSPLTIGDVKSRINLWLAEYGAENPEDTIFAIGRDAGVPHSSGTPSDPIKLGQTIVFDIFPCEKGGGYFYDFTRTWCLGYASDEVQKIYEQVLGVYNTVANELSLGINPNTLQLRTCELFEAYGHETVRTNPRVTQGYVHSLGHGVGLDVHEKPWFGRGDDPSNNLRPGSVFTLEPGLYYPEKGYGIRLEDTYYINQEGTFAKFVDYPMDLVIPMPAK
jgi:Xaa-Pro aminopeptidase